MRLPLPLLLLLSITFWDVSHCYHSPGTLPEEYEVPRNPYQSDSWTGYQFYYEKEPKKLAKPKTSGKLPAFQSIYTSDRESPEDPDQTTVVPTTVIPTTTVPLPKVEVSPSQSTKEEFENAAREPVETNDLKLTSDSGKKYGRKSTKKNQKCCSCCDAPRAPREPNLPVTKLDSPAIQQSVPLQNTIAGEAYVPQPEVAPPAPMVQPLVHPTYPTQPVTHYQQPFQQYQPQYQYPQSPIPIGGGCGCPAPPQNCCAPPAPCCLPTIPCCPSLPCCPQPRLCCQAAPPPTCCQLSFQLPTIPICGRACPTCPCRRRVHAARRLKRSNLNCQQCSAAAEPWRQPFSPSPSCTTCGPAHRQRVKRMGCLPCLASRRVKRMGCLPCLGGRKKRSAQNGNCTSCTSLGQLFTRYKRSLFGCQPCAPAPQNCSCGGRKKRSIISSPPMVHQDEQCDATCCDTSQCTKKNR